MKMYELFSEWANRTIYGDSLTDALRREGSLQRPRTRMRAGQYEEGEILRVGRVLKEHIPANRTRGGQACVQAVCEEAMDHAVPDAPRRIFEVDAVEREL